MSSRYSPHSLMIEKNLKHYTYAPETSLHRVLGDLYRKAVTICLVVDSNKKLLGVVTITDLKQAIFKGVDPNTPVRTVMNTSFVSAEVGTPLTKLRKLAMGKTKYKTGIFEKIPILDARGRLRGLYILPGSQEELRRTILVTGGAGYVGSHVCRLLLNKGYKVVVLDKLLFGDAGIRDLLKHKNFRLIKGDISNISTLIRAVQQADAVIHLAGIVGDPASALNPLHTMEQNHFATKAFIDVCKHYQIARFIFASSCSIYGANPNLLKEDSELRPVSLYAQSKRYSEFVLLKEVDDNFHPVILRFGTLYGLSPRMRFDLVVNIMTAHAHRHNSIMVDGGTQWRPLVHVEDAAAACIAALEAPLQKVSGQIFNVGDTQENYQIQDIAKAVQGHLPKTLIKQQDTVKDRRDYKVSFTKINQRMGWKVSRALAEGIAEIIAALQQGKFKQWSTKRYNNYLTLRSVLEDMP